MNKRRIILSLASITVILTHLMVSGGLIIVIHSCSSHHTTNITTFSVVNPNNEIENCCGAMEDDSCDSHLSAGCCEYNISDFNLSSFVTTSLFQDNDFQLTSDIFTGEQLTPKPFFQTPSNITFFNKHGGRYIVNFNHQIIS